MAWDIGWGMAHVVEDGMGHSLCHRHGEGTPWDFMGLHGTPVGSPQEKFYQKSFRLSGLAERTRYPTQPNLGRARIMPGLLTTSPLLYIGGEYVSELPKKAIPKRGTQKLPNTPKGH